MDNWLSQGVSVPGDLIRSELEKRNWTQEDLARILGRPLPVVSRIITGKTSITPDTARELAEALGQSPEYWLKAETTYRLSQSEKPVDDIRRRACLYEMAPVKDMERRGWIGRIDSIETLESELKKFFGVTSLDKLPMIPFAARSSATETPVVTAAQGAWCFKSAKLASGIQVARLTKKSFDDGCAKLRTLVDYPENIRHVPEVLAGMGIRLVVNEHLPNTKIDGAVIWIGDNSPVIAISVRYDRIDCFWHTLAHELSHVCHRDAYSLDEDLVGTRRTPTGEASDIELRADKEATELLIPSAELESFILRVKPFYSKQRIIQFANRIHVHPGIIAGQLQYRGEIQYNANREMLVKIRHVITQAAITDGWNTSVSC
ncbi:MAG: helix-turn-helix domain-containing protein [Phycisphaerales bacterium]